jgi:DNA-binding IclR family transcriptional regulator
MAASSIKSAERVMDVLQFLATQIQPVPSMTIARECHLPKSSAYHLLNSMRARQFVTYYSDQRAWGLGPSVFDVGGAHLRGKPLTWLARPLLREVADSFGVTAHLAILQGSDVLYLAKEDPPSGEIPLVSRVGLRLPAHLTAVGRSILMRLPPSHLHAIYPLTEPLVRLTGRGPVLVAELERELSEARKAGYAIEDGMTTQGVVCLAATVFSHENQPLAGVGVSLLSKQQKNRSDLMECVGDTAKQLSYAVGWRPQDASRKVHSEPRVRVSPRHQQRPASVGIC